MPWILLVLLALAAPVLAQQPTEKPVDPFSTRISIEGCADGKKFLVIEPREGEPVNVTVRPGRVFRLSGPKAVLKDLHAHDGTAVLVTGLVRKSALDPSTQGVGIGAGGRIRIGGGPPVSRDPTASPGRDPLGTVDVLDVETFRPVDATCPSKKD